MKKTILLIAVLVAAFSIAAHAQGNIGVASSEITSTVAKLPPAASCKSDTSACIRIVTDGNSSSDCTVGGGSTRVNCSSNGSVWAALGGSGGGISGLTTNVIPKATSATTIGDSSINDNGSTVSTAETIAAGGVGLAGATHTFSLLNGSDVANAAGAVTTDVSGNIGVVAPGSNGNVLTSNGTIWTSAAAAGGGQPIALLNVVGFHNVAGSTSTTFPVTNGSNGTDGNNRLYFPASCTLSHLRVEVNGTQGAGGSLTISTNINNGGASALIATVPANGTTGLFTDLTHSVAITEGQTLDWVVTNNDTGASVSILNISAKCS